MTPFLINIKDLCCSASKWHLALTFPSLKTQLNASIFHHKSAQNCSQISTSSSLCDEAFLSRTTPFLCYGWWTRLYMSSVLLDFLKRRLDREAVSWDRENRGPVSQWVWRDKQRPVAQLFWIHCTPCHRGCGTINIGPSLSYSEYIVLHVTEVVTR